MDFIKIKNFCSTKGPVKWRKRQATDREGVFAKHTSDKGLTSRMCKDFQNSTVKKKKYKMGKSGKEMLHQRVYTGKSKHMKRCLALISSREIRMKTTRYHCTSINMAKAIVMTSNAGKSCIAGGSVERCSHSGTLLGSFF